MSIRRRVNVSQVLGRRRVSTWLLKISITGAAPLRYGAGFCGTPGFYRIPLGGCFL